MSLARYFPEEDYRFTLRVERGEPREFFAPTAPGPGLRAERCRWLGEAPGRHAAALPEGAPVLEEAAGLFQAWTGAGAAGDGNAAVVEWGRRLEPDWLLLARDEEGAFRLVAGCVCFPSSWSLEEKMGRRLEEIHGVVPGLNAQVGRPVAGFLGKLAPGIAWLRANWGLSRSPELNQHPERRLPRLDATVTAGEVWLRIERQALVALPASGGVLFGIRMDVHSLAEVQAEPAARAGLRRALQTMPGAMAEYKGLATARERLLTLLE